MTENVKSELEIIYILGNLLLLLVWLVCKSLSDSIYKIERKKKKVIVKKVHVVDQHILKMISK